MDTKLMTITPEIAEQWLARNTDNRRIRPGLIKALASEIAEGRWQVTHQGIAFDEYGALLDGQHRLRAIIVADTPVSMYVTTGAPHSSFAVVDSGASRSFIDRVFASGADVSKEHAAIARVIELGAGETRRASYLETMGFINKHREALDWVVGLGGSKKGRRPASMMAVVARAWYTRDRARLAQFVEVFSTGAANSPADWAAIRLRDFLMSGKFAPKGATARMATYQKSESAIDMFLRGVPATKLYGTRDELFPVPGEFGATKRNTGKRDGANEGFRRTVEG